MTLHPLRFSQLKRIGQSPLHYVHALAFPPAQTRAMRIGSALDALVYQGISVDNVREMVKSEAERECVCGMFEALVSHGDAWELLHCGQTQRKIAWEIDGRACSGTPDVFDATRLVDLKSARSVHPGKFPWDARRLSYHAQLAWYQSGLRATGLSTAQDLLLVTVENVAPHPVTVFELTPSAILQGEKQWRLWFETLRSCERSDEWPGYTQSRVPFDVPAEDGFSLTINGEETEISE